MNPVMTTCQHCGDPVTATRKTRKYCCDACKQAAFYQRSAMSCFAPANSDAATTNGKTQDSGNAYMADSTIMVQSIPPPPELFADTVATEVPAQDNTLPDLLEKHFVPGTTGSEDLPYASDEPEQRSPVLSKESTDTPVVPASELLPTPEKTYQWVSSSLLWSLDMLTLSDADILNLFANPEPYWNRTQIKQLKWAAVRIRSIAETLLQLDNHVIGKNAFCDIAEALSAVCQTPEYRFLSSEFPYYVDVRELGENMLEFTEHIGDRHRFQLSYDTKVTLIASRYLLSALVPFVHFDNLGFTS